MRRIKAFWSLGGIVVTTFAACLFVNPSTAMAIDGTELNSSVGVWAPLLPGLPGDSGDSIGTVVGISGHHRFDGFRTSIESGVTYGVTEDAEMFGFDALLRDTWTFGHHQLSAGFGYSQMNWDQESGTHEIESDYQGAKVVTGWQTLFGRTPVWLDLSLGLYDLDGRYAGTATTASINDFTTTYGVDLKTDFDFFGIPSRGVLGLDYIDDFATWRNGAIGTDDAVVLNGSIEFRLF